MASSNIIYLKNERTLGDLGHLAGIYASEEVSDLYEQAEFY